MLSNERLVKVSAELANVVYDITDSSLESVRDTIESPVFISLRFICFGYNEVLVANSSEFMAISVRGTDEAREWANNLLVGLTDSAGSLGATEAARVHRGFHYRTDAVMKRVNRALNEERMLTELSSTTKPVVVTGHSSGGAIAALLGLRIATDFGLPVQVCAFGAPKIGNKKLYEDLKAHCYSVVFYNHYSDIVPKLPIHYRPNPLTVSLKSRHSPLAVVSNHLMENYKETIDVLC